MNQTTSKETARERLSKRIKRAEDKLQKYTDAHNKAKAAFEMAQAALLTAMLARNGARDKLRDLEESLMLIPADESQRYVVEATVEKLGTGTEYLYTNYHPNPVTGNPNSWSIRLSREQLSQYRKGDRIRLEYRFNPRRKEKWDVELWTPPARDEIHELVNYDS